MGLLRLLGIEKYLRKVKTYVDEKMAVPNWDAKDGEKGYIKNRTHYKDYGVWNDVNISVSGNTATISNIDMYEYIVFKTNDSGFYSEPVDLTVNTRHNVSFDGVSGIVQVTVIPAENIIKVVANNVADIKALIKEGIKPYIVITLSPEYLPEGLATEEYVNTNIDLFAENVLGPTAANLHERLSMLGESSSLISIIREDLPTIKIDVDGWSNNAMSFTQVGITDKHINKWILLSSLKVADIDSYGIEPQNTGDYFGSKNDVFGGMLRFSFDVDEGNVGIDFDLLAKEVYIHNDWE